MTYTEIDEIADGMGQLARPVTFAEALILAKRIMPNESHTITHNLAHCIQLRSRNQFGTAAQPLSDGGNQR